MDTNRWQNIVGFWVIELLDTTHRDRYKLNDINEVVHYKNSSVNGVCV